MNIVLIGASGFVGKALLNELINRNHQVTAVSRQLPPSSYRPGVQLVSMDVQDEPRLSELMKGHDAVVSAFNAGWQNPTLYEDFLAGSQAIQRSIKRAAVNRLLVVGGAGSLYRDGAQLVDAPDFPSAWKAGALAARDYLTQLREETQLDWVFVSPAIEMHPGTSGIRQGHYRTGSEYPVYDAHHKSSISVEDLAMAIVDELEQAAHHRERFTVAY